MVTCVTDVTGVTPEGAVTVEPIEGVTDAKSGDVTCRAWPIEGEGCWAGDVTGCVADVTGVTPEEAVTVEPIEGVTDAKSGDVTCRAWPVEGEGWAGGVEAVSP